MPDIWLNVDGNLGEVPVNIMPLIDDTDFKTREVSIAWNQAGMDLVWNFVDILGQFTQTAVIPTTGGDYDWAHQGDGMYTIEMPNSEGASINNDAEGFGWFEGVCTGVLPWRGPIIGFRAAGLNQLMIANAWSSTRGLAGTALPDASCDAAGGLPKSDAGALDIDNDAANALVAINLDHLMKTAVSNRDTIPEVVDDTVLANLMTKTDGDTSDYDHATDSLEALRDRGDAAWAGAPESVSGTIVVDTADTIFDLTATLGTLSTQDDTYNDMIVCILDNSGSVYETARITDYDGTNTRITINHELTFPVQDGVDTFVIYRAAFNDAGTATISEADKNDIVDKMYDEETRVAHQTRNTGGWFWRRNKGRY